MITNTNYVENARKEAKSGFKVKNNFRFDLIINIIYASYTNRLCLKNHQQMPDTQMERIMAMMNPQGFSSIPLTRFIPNIEVMSVGIIMMMVTEVSVRITVFILLLMMLW